ncbi:hypothetical protein FACS189499_06690 [Clostridia bacterium]|nr:hypothetical protein FACS189499_06690 [Clostridia bacterium]
MKMQTLRRDPTDTVAVKFVSYDGKYPCLCNGVLTIEIDGERFELNNALSSGGTCSRQNDYSPTYGDWTFSEYDELPNKARLYSDVVLQLVNNKVKHGCCGGCA